MRKFFVGLILGAGLMMGMSASAEVVSYVGKVIEGQFPVKVRGESISSPGIVVDGISYLPTRTIAELAGFDVKFDADMGVELTEKTGSKTTNPATADSPTYKRYQEVVKEYGEVSNNFLHLRNEIIRVKGTTNQDVTDLEQKLSEYESLMKELETEKAQLEAQLTGASK